MRYSTLLDRLQNLINYRPSQTELASIINIRPNAMSGRCSRNSDFSELEILEIEQHYGVDLYGENVTHCDNVTLDYYPEINASCGAGCFPISEQCEKIQVDKSLITNYSNNNKYMVINAQGESMAPEIHDHDKIIIEQVLNNQIQDDQVYVFAYDNAIYTKRLIKNVNELVIKSDNPDKETYRTQYLNKEDMNKINIIGRVIGLVRSYK